MRRTIEEIIASYEHTIGDDVARRINGAMQLDITGAGGGSYFFEVENSALRVGPGRHASPAATVVVTADDFLRINSGTATVFELAVEGRLRVTGSLQLANRYQTLLLRRS